MLRREDISGVVRIIIVGSWPGKGGGGGSLRGWFDEVTGPCFSVGKGRKLADVSSISMVIEIVNTLFKDQFKINSGN